MKRGKNARKRSFVLKWVRLEKRGKCEVSHRGKVILPSSLLGGHNFRRQAGGSRGNEEEEKQDKQAFVHGWGWMGEKGMRRGPCSMC